ncbi:hypothetical protein N7474_008246 [Penicillium riverlandense]|uniref:uncharacterized protein n=1 Tax=Penicillium riverlandense TaxID=1903569 RepID=UPI002546B060|nr:uncharacterized protein N7474_008246 [Penicillium riverlandense]KAJ5811945.1 hypothetical protein N7474_008246 [Penicillium riverlandense]
MLKNPGELPPFQYFFTHWHSPFLSLRINTLLQSSDINYAATYWERINIFFTRSVKSCQPLRLAFVVNQRRLFTGILPSILSPAFAQPPSSPASIFIYPLGSTSEDFTFALNIPNDSTDLYFHLSGPTSYSWVAVGTGSEMQNSLMMVIYASTSGNNVTLSPRLSSGEQEPVYSSSLAVEILEGTSISNNTMTVNARCSNCTNWETGSLDLKSTDQSWIFALGPIGSNARMLQSDSKTANLERHSEYGQFFMDMVHATGGSGGLPTSYTTAAGSSLTSVTSDSNWPSIIHALCLCGAFILLMPSGVILLRVFPKSVRWHWVNQTISTGLSLIGIVIGFYLSTMFTKSQSYDSTHQILGIIILLAMLLQLGMGFWHHWMYKRTQSPTRYGILHRYFGWVVIFLAIINGGIGLTWSYTSRSVVIGYSVAVATIGLAVFAAVSWARWTSVRSQKGHIREPMDLHRLHTGYRLNDSYSQAADSPPPYE